MSFSQLAALALTACVGLAAAEGKKEFPLVWVCLGITVVGVVIALYVAYRRPDELHLPGSTVMTAQETEGMEGELHSKHQNAEYAASGYNDKIDDVPV